MQSLLSGVMFELSGPHSCLMPALSGVWFGPFIAAPFTQLQQTRLNKRMSGERVSQKNVNRKERRETKRPAIRQHIFFLTLKDLTGRERQEGEKDGEAEKITGIIVAVVNVCM